MNANTEFLDNISKLKKRVMLRIFTRIFLITVLLFLCLYTIITGIEKTGRFDVPKDVSFYLIFLGFSLGVALLYAYIKRESFAKILIDIDSRLELQDRISTAYEYHTSEKTSEFTELLVDDAGRRLSRLNNKQLFPPKFSIVHLLLIILLVTNIALFLVDRFFPASEQTYFDKEQSEKISAMLKNYTRKKADPKEKPKQESQKRFREKMENITKKLEEQSMPREKLAQSLHETLNEVQGEQTRLAKDLQSKLENIKDVRNVPVQKIPQVQQLSSEEQSKLRKMLKEMLGDQFPESIEQTLESLDETRNLAELLEQILDDLESDSEAEDESDESDATARKDGESGEGESGTQNDTQNEASSDSQQDGEGKPEQAMSIQSQRIGDGEGTEEDPDGADDDESRLAGRGQSQGQKYSSHELETSQGPVLQDKTRSGQRGEYNVHIRSVTSIGKAELPEEDVVRPYQQEVEGILQQEEIPLNYREYIKNYFISIGLREED